jgi:hypothetical protein
MPTADVHSPQKKEEVGRSLFAWIFFRYDNNSLYPELAPIACSRSYRHPSPQLRRAQMRCRPGGVSPFSLKPQPNQRPEALASNLP